MLPPLIDLFERKELSPLVNSLMEYTEMKMDPERVYDAVKEAHVLITRATAFPIPTVLLTARHGSKFEISIEEVNIMWTDLVILIQKRSVSTDGGLKSEHARMVAECEGFRSRVKEATIQTYSDEVLDAKEQLMETIITTLLSQAYTNTNARTGMDLRTFDFPSQVLDAKEQLMETIITTLLSQANANTNARTGMDLRTFDFPSQVLDAKEQLMETIITTLQSQANANTNQLDFGTFDFPRRC
eukprot:gene19908-26611_t